jgi:type IV pilus biogenesis protein CpaD/CtpE
MKPTEILNEALNESAKEYVIWGIPPGYDSEIVVAEKIPSKSGGVETISDKKMAKKIEQLMKKKGVKKTRIQEIDMRSGFTANDFTRGIK